MHRGHGAEALDQSFYPDRFIHDNIGNYITIPS